MSIEGGRGVDPNLEQAAEPREQGLCVASCALAPMCLRKVVWQANNNLLDAHLSPDIREGIERATKSLIEQSDGSRIRELGCERDCGETNSLVETPIFGDWHVDAQTSPDLIGTCPDPSPPYSR